MNNKWMLLPLVLLFCLSCVPEPSLTIMTHDSFEVSANLIEQFEKEHNIQVQFIKSGDTGSALNRAILTKSNPVADVFYGVDNTFLSRALNEQIFEPYSPANLSEIPSDFILDVTNTMVPIDYGDVCINYDITYFAQNALLIPASFEDLLQPAYKGMLVVENPATSSPGLAFLLATISHYGDPGYLDYWERLTENGTVIVNDWSTAYYTNFSASSGHGAQPMVVSYASSPAAEVIYADPPREDAPTASLLTSGMCFRQIEFVGILKGTKNRALAEAFIDFLLSKPFQEDLPLQMFVYPVLPGAELPGEFKRYALLPAEPIIMDPEYIAQNREQWIRAWTEQILK